MSTPCSNRKAPCSNEHGAFFGVLRGSVLASPVLGKATLTKTKDTPVGFLSLLSSFPKQLISAHGAGTPLPPSEEGGGCLHKGFEQADGGRDTVSMCESSRHSQQQKQMTAFSFGARLHLGANSTLALSLPQSRCFNPFSSRQLPPQREPRTRSVSLGAQHSS